MLTTRGTAVVTGASSGIGAEFARQLAEGGMDLVLVARREDRLRELADDIARRHGVRVEREVADLLDPSDLERVERRLGEVDELTLLVNSAGHGARGAFTELPWESHERLLRLHVLVPMRLSRAALRVMEPRRRGAVVCVASLAGFVPGYGSVSYSSAKALLIHFAEALEAELAGTGLRVQTLCPGFTDTEFFEGPEMGTGVRAEIPRWLISPTDEVVRASLDALERNRAVVVPGGINRAIRVVARRPLVRRVLRAAGRQRRRVARRGA